MNDKKKTRDRSRGTYRVPALRVYGDLKSTTLVKKGSKNDGGAKPQTRASGSNA